MGLSPPPPPPNQPNLPTSTLTASLLPCQATTWLNTSEHRQINVCLISKDYFYSPIHLSHFTFFQKHLFSFIEALWFYSVLLKWQTTLKLRKTVPHLSCNMSSFSFFFILIWKYNTAQKNKYFYQSIASSQLNILEYWSGQWGVVKQFSRCYIKDQQLWWFQFPQTTYPQHNHV